MELPRISFVKVRSTLAALLMIIPQLLAAFGTIDPGEVSTVQSEGIALLDQLLANFVHLLSTVGAIWLWFERRNPKFRIALFSDPIPS